jgi:preprotein translocase subunit SecG
MTSPSPLQPRKASGETPGHSAGALLRIEFRRFLPNATVRTVAVLYVVFFAGSLALAHLISEGFQVNANGTTLKPLQNFLEYPKNWQILAWLGSWFNVTLLGFLGVFLITLDFQHKTLRQSILFGLTRGETAAAKSLFLPALAGAATLVYLFLGFAIGAIGGAFSLPPLFSLGGFFLQALGYLALGTLAGLLLRQTALAVIAYLAYVIFLESVVRWTITLALEPIRALSFLPDHVLETLAPFPVPESVTQAAQSALASLPASLTHGESLLAVGTYLALAAWFFHRHLGKADL